MVDRLRVNFVMNPTLIIYAVSILSMLTFGTAQAEFVGLNINLQQNSSALPVHFDNGEPSSIDLVDDLALEDSQQSSMALILEHPIRALPNLRYSGFDLDFESRTSLDQDISLDGAGFTDPDQARSHLDLSQDDIVLYYQLVDSSIDLDLGVDLKRFDGQITTTGETAYSIEVDETIPLLYLSARYQLPNSGFYIGADINSSILDLGLSDSSAEDSTIRLGYESDNGIGVEGGYKYYSLDLDNGDDLDAEFEFDGIFLKGYYDF